MSKTPQATIAVGESETTRDVCSVQLRTRAEGSNMVCLTGGADIKVDDEFAKGVIDDYFGEGRECTCGENQGCHVCGGKNE